MASFITALTTQTASLARPNRYKMYIGPVASIGDVDTRNIEINCSALTMPGSSIATTDHREARGHVVKMPYDRIYNPVTATFYNSIDHEERVFFERWISSINTGHNNKFTFYDEFTSVINIMQLDCKHMVTNHIKLMEVYPIALSDLELGYANENAVEQFNVTFTYRHYKVQKLSDTMFKNIFDMNIFDVFDGGESILDSSGNFIADLSDAVTDVFV